MEGVLFDIEAGIRYVITERSSRDYLCEQNEGDEMINLRA